MGKRKQRERVTVMRAGKESRDANFIACLLANGPPPSMIVRVAHLHGTTGSSNYIALEKYKHDVREWWRSCHNCEPMPTEKGLHRFYNRFRRWYSEENYRHRKAMNVVGEWADE